MVVTLRLLTVWNLACPGLLALLAALAWLFKLDTGGGSATDVGLFVLAWCWLLVTPVTAIAGLALGRRLRSRASFILHAAVLAAWLITLLALLFLVR
jgi:hypothetical protein